MKRLVIIINGLVFGKPLMMMLINLLLSLLMLELIQIFLEVLFILLCLHRDIFENHILFGPIILDRRIFDFYHWCWLLEHSRRIL